MKAFPASEGAVLPWSAVAAGPVTTARIANIAALKKDDRGFMYARPLADFVLELAHDSAISAESQNGDVGCLILVRRG
jgi:hypothetical protein